MAKPKPVTPQETKKVEAYLRKLFGNRTIELRARPRAADAVEMYVGNEFVGVISKDTEDGDVCYQISMTVLEMDLEESNG
ncbi:MAG: DUF3126 family protein [Hyphomicrobiaceae bacterium]